MTLPVPLTVRLANADVDRHIEKDLRDLSFRSVDPGGFASATFSLDRPLSRDAPELAYFTRVYIYSGINIVWEGRIEDPGRGVGADGQVWQIAAVGPLVHLSDDARQLFYADTSNERWRRGGATVEKAIAKFERNQHAEDDDDDQPGFILSWLDGSTVTSVGTPSRIDAIYRAVYYAGLKLGRVRADLVNGTANSDRFNRLITRIGPAGAGTVVESFDWSTGDQTLDGSRGGGNAIPADHDTASLRITVLTGGAVVAGPGAYTEFWNLVVRQLLKTKAGADITSGYTNNYILPHEVVADLLGRMLPLYDGTNATVDTSSTYQINHLVYPAGATAEQVLTDLLAFQPTFTYQVWESNSAGLYRFEWKPKPTMVRYQASVVDGFDTQGSAADLYNRAQVHYVDWQGRDRQLFVTQAVPQLDDNGLTRTLQVDVGDEISTAANATTYGEGELADHAIPQAGGTLTIARPVMDLDTGMMVQPWEIRPGELIRVSGIQASRDGLNANARDGQTVFHIVSTEYNVSSAAATLELDSYSRSMARALANLQKKPRRKIGGRL